jgi:hypothetical protein
MSSRRRTTPAQSSWIAAIPGAILCEVIGFLSLADHITARHVCSRWNITGHLPASSPKSVTISSRTSHISLAAIGLLRPQHIDTSIDFTSSTLESFLAPHCSRLSRLTLRGTPDSGESRRRLATTSVASLIERMTRLVDLEISDDVPVDDPSIVARLCTPSLTALTRLQFDVYWSDLTLASLHMPSEGARDPWSPLSILHHLRHVSVCDRSDFAVFGLGDGICSALSGAGHLEEIVLLEAEREPDDDDEIPGCPLTLEDIVGLPRSVCSLTLAPDGRSPWPMDYLPSSVPSLREFTSLADLSIAIALSLNEFCVVASIPSLMEMTHISVMGRDYTASDDAITACPTSTHVDTLQIRCEASVIIDLLGAIPTLTSLEVEVHNGRICARPPGHKVLAPQLDRLAFVRCRQTEDDMVALFASVDMPALSSLQLHPGDTNANGMSSVTATHSCLSLDNAIDALADFARHLGKRTRHGLHQ